MTGVKRGCYGARHRRQRMCKKEMSPLTPYAAPQVPRPNARLDNPLYESVERRERRESETLIMKALVDAKNRFVAAEKANRLLCSNAERLKATWCETQHALTDEGKVALEQEVVFVPRGPGIGNGLMRGRVSARTGMLSYKDNKILRPWIFVVPNNAREKLLAFKNRHVWPVRPCKTKRAC